jgi:thymidylate kinase
MFKLIVFEGPDGCGKSTLTMKVLEKLRKRYPQFAFITTREPNNLVSGLRGVVLNPELTLPTNEYETVRCRKRLPARISIGITAASAGASMYFAEQLAQIQDKPVVLLADRSVFSAYAYQSLANDDIPVDEKLQFSCEIMHTYHTATDNKMIDLVIWLTGQFNSDDPDVYTELGHSSALADAYAVMRKYSQRLFGSSEWASLMKSTASSIRRLGQPSYVY